MGQCAEVVLGFARNAPPSDLRTLRRKPRYNARVPTKIHKADVILRSHGTGLDATTVLARPSRSRG